MQHGKSLFRMIASVPGEGTPRLRAAVASTLGAAWAVSGTALIAVMVAIAAGGATYALRAPAAPAASPQKTTGASTDENVRVALKAADDSRVIFGLLSNAVTSSSSGLAAAMSGVPQIFDSVDTARAGAAEVVAGLEETATTQAALNEVTESAGAWANTLDQVQGVSGLSVAVRSSSTRLRQQLVENPTPGSHETVEQLDHVLAATDGLKTLESVDQLKSSLTSLTTLSGRSAGALASARSAAHRLHDGLATIAHARPDAEAAMNNLSTGTKQLGIALKSIDDQLALIQTRLQAESRDTEQPVAAVATDDSTRLAWALFAAGSAGALAYLVALAVHQRMRRAPVPAGAPEAPLADLARAISEIPTPSHGFPRPDAHNTDPWLPVQFAREK
ncbi:hypothetical protein TSST111916_17890 [Tsukamurella strandjordii]